MDQNQIMILFIVLHLFRPLAVSINNDVINIQVFQEMKINRVNVNNFNTI